MEKSDDFNNCLKLYRVLNRNETDYGALFHISTIKVNTFCIKLIMELYLCIDIDFMLLKNLRLFYFYLCFIFIALQLKKKTLFNQGSVNHLVLKDTLLKKIEYIT